MKTVNVKIALVIDQEGKWNSNGYGDEEGNRDETKSMSCACDVMEETAERFWVECQVVSSGYQVIPGEVTKAGSNRKG